MGSSIGVHHYAEPSIEVCCFATMIFVYSIVGPIEPPASCSRRSKRSTPAAAMRVWPFGLATELEKRERVDQRHTEHVRWLSMVGRNARYLGLLTISERSFAYFD